MDENYPLFIEKEVNFQIGEIKLAGTLSIPKKVGKSPAVILLSGYGSCTRDYEERGMRKFRIISSYLANNGIAVLRFDDRGSGDSTNVDWDQYTFKDLSNEAFTALHFLKDEKNIDSSQIGLLGHSLGAAIAPLAASESEEIAFIILLGGHGLLGNRTAAITRGSLGPMMGETNEATKKGVRLVERIFQVIQSKEGWEEIKPVVFEEMKLKFERLSDEQQKMYKTFDNYLQSTYEGFLLLRGYTPMYRSFLRYDPRSYLEKTNCPALLFFAGLDNMHPPNKHMDPMVKALKNSGNKNFNVEIFDEADHEFTTVESRKKGEFIPELLPAITNWININFQP